MATAMLARPMVTFPAAERHRPLTGARLYCLVIGEQLCEQVDYCPDSVRSHTVTGSQTRDVLASCAPCVSANNRPKLRFYLY